jgi:hypothetical protein
MYVCTLKRIACLLLFCSVQQFVACPIYWLTISDPLVQSSTLIWTGDQLKSTNWVGLGKEQQQPLFYRDEKNNMYSSMYILDVKKPLPNQN